MKKMLLAIQFLTIIPVKIKGDVSEKDMVDSSIFFPVAGACQGLMITLTAAVMVRFFDAAVVCGLIMLAHIISNGGFDLDGLADTADGLSVKSSGNAASDIEKRLLVMKDSTIGAAGATAIVMSLMLKFLLLNSLFHLVPLSLFLGAVFMMTVFSKWVTVPAMLHCRSARKDGLGRIFIDNIKAGHLIGSTLVLFILFVVSFFSVLQDRFHVGYTFLFVLLVVSQYLLSIAAVQFFRKRLGGMTGDTLGALSEASEIISLMVTYTWLRHSIS
ncbi:MAG: adenosylcobinamide-GDP ribazoletransferase [Nitrospirae bacterium]|nr:adenosylcobinamide-GDP ribazoletransferase [Nitrospirota bacterium]